jgi:hypothetical protein
LQIAYLKFYRDKCQGRGVGGNRNEWDLGFDFSPACFPEWEFHRTGQLSFRLKRLYLWGGSPRRWFRDTKIQRLEARATDIAVGMAMLAAAIKKDRLRRRGAAQRCPR